MFVKIIKTYRDVVAICDSEILGKKFEEGDFQIDVKESFYKGEEMNEIEVSELMVDKATEDATFNIVGEKSIALALKVGIISKESIRKIEGIPVALILV